MLNAMVDDEDEDEDGDEKTRFVRAASPSSSSSSPPFTQHSALSTAQRNKGDKSL